MNMVRGVAAFLAFVICTFLPTQESIASGQLFVDTGAQIGQAVLWKRTDGCFALSPTHVVSGARRANLTAFGRVRGEAHRDAQIGHDISIIRLAKGVLNCEKADFTKSDLSELFASETLGTLVSMTESGALERRSVRLTRVDRKFVGVRPLDTRVSIYQGLSGSRLLVDGQLAGILLAYDPARGAGKVIRADFLSGILEAQYGDLVLWNQRRADGLLPSQSRDGIAPTERLPKFPPPAFPLD